MITKQPDQPAVAPSGPSAPAAGGTALSRELRSTARGGAVTLVGSLFSTLMGFTLALVLARTLGAQGSGIVLQTIAAVMIALALTRLGMDTTAVWVIPRLKLEDPASVRGACTGLVGSAAVAGSLGALVWLGLTGWLVDEPGLPVVDTVTAVIWAVPFGAVMLVALAATRGFGGVLPFNVIGNIAVPASRPTGVLVVTAAGGAVLASALAWAAPLVPGALIALWVMHRQVSRYEAAAGVRGRFWPRWPTQRRIFGFALPRTVSSGLEQSIIWFDVVLVGIIAGAAAAGIYGAASRFVAAGVVVLTALRIVVAPRFSAYLAERRHAELQELYSITASWILLFGGPIYVLLAVFSPTILGWLGGEFVEGTTAMTILCAGALVLLAGGNVQSLLLMSGRSGWGAVNKGIVFGVNVTLNLLLVPSLGFLGAAVAWAFCMSLDTSLAAFQVHRFTGIRPSLGRLAQVAAAVVLTAGVPALTLLWWLGNETTSLLLAAACTAVLVPAYAYVDRRRLHLADLLALLPGRRGRATSPEAPAA